ncbi:hypothetical protein CUJ89_26920 [Burkholderia pyrrocinia]|uniref:Uncharacterized protein n=1 Tax=Burkholderia pyrrocinia TaxID=60550 RepID=A0A2Z5N4W9_BURPY|nr:hypothetical protein [Burkholderia pyrrocinia]AXF23988.1 hypothetical protein CUJ89_26920 [Burkholderia pyrrocinia]
MQAVRHFHLELRHASVPTYVASYVFPILLLAYEVLRVGRWIAEYGMNFMNFRFMGYEFLLMLVFVALQVGFECVFLIAAWISRNHDFEHRVANLLAGLGCSLVVIGFDLALQYGL